MAANDPFEQSVLISAHRHRVWRELTDPDRMSKWTSDEAMTVTLDARVGGRLLMHGTMHGRPFENRAVVTVFDAPQTFEYRYWSTLSSGRLADAPENYSTVRFSLREDTDGATLQVTLKDFPEPSMRPHSIFYWNTTLNIIKRHAEADDCGRPGRPRSPMNIATAAQTRARPR